MLTLTRPNHNLFNDWSREFDRFFNFNDNLKSDVLETKEGYEIKVEIPGVEKDDIEIFLTDDLLMMKVNKKKTVDENKKYCFNEIKYGFFEKSWRIPFKTSEDKISAKHKNGILVLTIPKIKEKKHTIMIE